MADMRLFPPPAPRAFATGCDIVDIRRVEELLKRFGDRFTEKIFTPHENAQAQKKSNKAAWFAKRFAAKEACLKALGTGMREGLGWHDMEIRNTPQGQPILVLQNGVKTFMTQNFGKNWQCQLSLSDERDYALAFVVVLANR